MNVAVAEDVLKLLPFLKVAHGYGYVLFNDATTHLTNLHDRGIKTPYCGNAKTLQENIPKIARRCTVCARGAMFLARIHLYDGVKNLFGPDPRRSTALWFGKQMAEAIECAFELWVPNSKLTHGSPTYKLQTAAHQFGEQFKNPKIRLRAIMKNIIVNNGIFDPTDLNNKGKLRKPKV
jgi:hypothetical protein